MRRTAVVGAVAAVSTVVLVPAASAAADSVSGSCRVDGFSGHAKMVYKKAGDTYRPTGITLGAGPHLGEKEPLSTRARMRISHVEHGAEIVDFDRARNGIKTGDTVAQKVEDVEVPVAAAMTMTVTFTFVKPGGRLAACRVVRDV